MKYKTSALLALPLFGLVLIARDSTHAQTELPKLQPQEIVTSLERLGQPTDDARSLIALKKINKTDLPLLARVIENYQGLANTYCGGRFRMRAAFGDYHGTSVSDYCIKDSYPMMAALSKGNIALHHLASQAKGLGSWWNWGWSKDPDVRQVQFFRAEPIWGYEYGEYYPLFGR